MRTWYADYSLIPSKDKIPLGTFPWSMGLSTHGMSFRRCFSKSFPRGSCHGFILFEDKGKRKSEGFLSKVLFLKNRILVSVFPVEELLVAYYIKGLPTPIAVWVKRAHKVTLQEAFAEAIYHRKICSA